jgi:molybdopterin/thiamine biosynthesis adenylyltransferase/molybdopterin converting factor small subunit
MARVLIPTPLRQFTGKQDSVEAVGGTVGEVLAALTAQYPDLKKQIFTDEGKVRSFVNVYLNDEDIRYLGKDATPAKDGDTISLVPSIAGGSTVAAPPEEVTLSKDEILRYSRHLIIPEVGIEGQKKLKAAKVLLIGTGGLGAPLGLYLTAAGIGRIGLVDFDVVDFTNLQRQVIHTTPDIGRPKVESAADLIRRLNPHVKLEIHAMRLTADNAIDLISRYDIVADGSDNFATRYLVSDACYFARRPLVTAAVGPFDGTLTTLRPHETGTDGKPNPTYRCLFPEPPPPGTVPACAEAGILGALPGVLGSLMAFEVIREIVKFGEGLVGRLLMIDALAMRFETLRYAWDPANPLSGDSPTIKALTGNP